MDCGNGIEGQWSYERMDIMIMDIVSSMVSITESLSLRTDTISKTDGIVTLETHTNKLIIADEYSKMQ